MTRDSDAAEIFMLADRVGATTRAERAFDRLIARAALSAVGNRDIRSEKHRARDRRIDEFRSWFCAALGEDDGALATACAWPGTEGARRV